MILVLLVLLLIVHTLCRAAAGRQCPSKILQTRCALATSRPGQRVELRKQIVLARRTLSGWDIGRMKVRSLYQRGRRDGVLLALPGALAKLLFWAQLAHSTRLGRCAARSIFQRRFELWNLEPSRSTFS